MAGLKVVSFVNDKIENNEDLNSLFVLPIKLKNISDKTKIDMMNDVQKKYKDSNWLRDGIFILATNQNKTTIDNIKTYIDQNVLDLYRTSVINFCATYLSKYLDNIIYTNISIPENMTISYYFTKNYFLHTLPVLDKSLLYTYFDQAADICIRNISILYNEYIYSMILRLMNTGRIVELYEDYYKTIYNEDPTDYNPGFVYTFCISIMRDQIELEIMKIREGMVLILNNASAFMISDTGIQNYYKEKEVKSIEENKDGNS